MISKPAFTFIDLFSGIGGFRIALEKLGGVCLGFSEIDKNAISVYKNNFHNSNEEIELGSVENLNILPLSDVDLVVGGVPCQAWSVAGKKRGFDDPRGKLWFDTIRIVELNRPKSFIFENVKGLADPRNRESLNFLLSEFKKIGYDVKWKVINSFDFGLPQNRDRIFIVGKRKDIRLNKEFIFPDPVENHLNLHHFLDLKASKFADYKKSSVFTPNDLFGQKIPFGRTRFQSQTELNDFFIFCDTRDGHTTIHSWDLIETTPKEKDICNVIMKNRRKKIYGNQDGNPMPYETLKRLIGNISPKDISGLIEKKILREVEGKGFEFVNSKNSSGINGIYRIYLPTSRVFSTLTATGTKDKVSTVDIFADKVKDYKDIFLKEVYYKGNFRELTPRECGNLQGFPLDFNLHEDDRIAKKQFGNAVSTNVIYYLAEKIIQTGLFHKIIDEPTRKKRSAFPV